MQPIAKPSRVESIGTIPGAHTGPANPGGSRGTGNSPARTRSGRHDLLRLCRNLLPVAILLVVAVGDRPAIAQSTANDPGQPLDLVPRQSGVAGGASPQMPSPDRMITAQNPPAPTAGDDPRSEPSVTQTANVASLPRVKTRYGRHKEFRRIVFEWPRSIEYRLTRKNNGATFYFSRPGQYDISRFSDTIRRAGIAITQVSGTQYLTVKIDYPPNRRLRHYRSGGIVVIDIFDEPKAQSQQRGAKAKKAASKSSKRKKSKKQAAKKPARQQDKPGRGSGTSPSKSKVDHIPVAVRPKVEELPASKSVQTDRKSEPAIAGAASNPAPGNIAEPKPMAAEPAVPMPAGVPPRLTATRKGDNLTLQTDWPTQVALAAFRRGRHIWLVFSTPHGPDLAQARAALGGGFFAIQRIEHKAAVVLRIAAARNLNPVVRGDGRSWTIEIGPRSLRPKTSVSVVSLPHAAAGSHVFLKAGGNAPAIALTDPEVGDALIVVPVSAPGLGVEPERNFAEFRVLPSTQGVVVEPYSAEIQVGSVMDGVIVKSGRGLRLSSERDAKQSMKQSKDPAALLFDFAKWGGRKDKVRKSGFTTEKQRLQNAIVAASDANRNSRRLDLARFLFSRGHTTDALGLLQIIIKDDEELLADRSVRGMRGGARFLTNNLDGAAEDLFHEALDDEPEISIWRGALSATQRKWRAAVAHFERAQGLLRYYPRRLKIRFALLAAKAELASGAIHRARTYLSILEDAKPRRSDLDELRFYRGKVLEQIGEQEAALALWKRIASKGTGSSRVKSEVARISLLRSQGRLTDVDEAIASLDRLRYAWRGDANEFAVLHTLGRLYLDKNDYQKGFETLLRARRLYPGLARESQLLADMQNGFARLYIDGAAEKIPPIKALALFQEFRKLIPPGARGNIMIERLTDRLVAVDLLGHAAQLLADQIARRLRGTEKARVGARLALVYLLNDNPNEALNAIAATDVPEMPAELAAQRRRLSARAHSALGQNSRAMALLERDGGRDAELLRADIYWRDQKWDEAAKVFARLTMDIKLPTGDAKFDEADSRLVLRWAVSLALSTDDSNLRTLRDRFDAAMERGPYADAYRVVATEIAHGGAFDYQTIVAKVAEVDRFQAFMANYRKQLRGAGLSTIN